LIAAEHRVRALIDAIQPAAGGDDVWNNSVEYRQFCSDSHCANIVIWEASEKLVTYVRYYLLYICAYTAYDSSTFPRRHDR
ncbi:hypothetical protein TELCIR_15579, partial [Teladorsagia circumcincta]